jgi:hypothetical protein
MKALRIAVAPAMLVLCLGIAVSQDVSHDVDKTASKAGHFAKHAGKKVGHSTKASVKDAGRGTKVVAKDSTKGVKKTGEGIKDAASK